MIESADRSFNSKEFQFQTASVLWSPGATVIQYCLPVVSTTAGSKLEIVSGDSMQDLGKARMHTLAHSGRKNDDVECCSHDSFRGGPRSEKLWHAH